MKNRIISFLGGDGLTEDFKLVTAAHVLLMLASSLSSVFISVFLFKMNGSDYLLTAKYNASLFFFEIVLFIIILFLFKFISVTSCLKAGLLIYSFSYTVLLFLRNDLKDYYLIIAFLLSLGASFYWTAHYNLLRQHMVDGTRQRALGFLGICCYIVSMVASPISGLIINSFQGMTGYIVVFIITVICFLLAANISSKIKTSSLENKKIDFLKWNIYSFKNKGLMFIFVSELARGMRDGVAAYYVTILLYSVTNSELIIGLSLMLKNVSSLFANFYIKNTKNPKQRLVSTAFASAFDIVILLVITLNSSNDVGSALIFIYSFIYVCSATLLNNNLQMPLFDAMSLIIKKGGSDTVVFTIRQTYLNIGRVLGIVVIILLPQSPVYGIYALVIMSGFALCSTFLGSAGAKYLEEANKS